MSTIYLSCVMDFSAGGDPSGAFGYTELPSGDYPAPVGGNYLRATFDNTDAATTGVVFMSGDTSGSYEINGYSYAGSVATTAESGPVFGVYTYRTNIGLHFALPAGLTGEVRAYAKVETAASSGIDFVAGGGAGYVVCARSAPVPYVDLFIDFHTSEEDAITVTVHLVGGPGEPAAPFWTGFVGTHEIV